MAKSKLVGSASMTDNCEERMEPHRVMFVSSLAIPQVTNTVRPLYDAANKSSSIAHRRNGACRLVKPSRIVMHSDAAPTEGDQSLHYEEHFHVPDLEQLQMICLYDKRPNDDIYEPRQSLPSMWHAPGCYGVYDEHQNLMYVEITKGVSTSIKWHMQCLPREKCMFAKAWIPVPPSTASSVPEDVLRQRIQETAIAWITAYLKETGKAPEGNDKRFQDSLWRKRPGDVVRSKPPVTFPPGSKPEDALAILPELVSKFDLLVFMKGTRVVPQCGFSERMCRALDENGIDFDVVDVLDETGNPGLRQAIKEFSEWPTIPQLFVKGELMGGCDVVESMNSRNELKKYIKQVLGK